MTAIRGSAAAVTGAASGIGRALALELAARGCNLALADRFLKGVREAGVTVGQDANVLLHVSTSRLGGTSPGATRGAEQTYSELGGLAGGGMRPRLSPLPTTGMRASRSAPAAQRLLALRVDASWAASSAACWGRGWSGRRSELPRSRRCAA